jgi:hypothetical protein
VGALDAGLARGIGTIFGLENGLQADLDVDPFGDAPALANIILEDSGVVVLASANVAGLFDVDVQADVGVSLLPPVFGVAGPDDPFITPIDPIPGLEGEAKPKVLGGKLRLQGVFFERHDAMRQGIVKTIFAQHFLHTIATHARPDVIPDTSQ